MRIMGTVKANNKESNMDKQGFDDDTQVGDVMFVVTIIFCAGVVAYLSLWG